MIQKWINENGYPENINIYSVATHIDKTMPNYPPNEWLSREEWSVPVIFDDKKLDSQNIVDVLKKKTSYKVKVQTENKGENKVDSI